MEPSEKPEQTAIDQYLALGEAAITEGQFIEAEKYFVQALQASDALRSMEDSSEHRRVYVNVLYKIGQGLEKQGERDRAGRGL